MLKDRPSRSGRQAELKRRRSYTSDGEQGQKGEQSLVPDSKTALPGKDEKKDREKRGRRNTGETKRNSLTREFLADLEARQGYWSVGGFPKVLRCTKRVGKNGGGEGAGLRGWSVVRVRRDLSKKKKGEGGVKKEIVRILNRSETHGVKNRGGKLAGKNRSGMRRPLV